MPPASPTTAARTMMPNRSSRARTAANPPLRPKTNVPARLRTRISVGSKPCGTSISQQHVRIPGGYATGAMDAAALALDAEARPTGRVSQRSLGGERVEGGGRDGLNAGLERGMDNG